MTPFEWLVPFAFKAIEYLVVTVFLKYIVGKWIAEKVSGLLKYLIVKTQRDAVYWLHYREKAMKHGHKYRNPEECGDGVCGSYHASLKRS